MPTTIITKYGVSPGVPPADGELAIGELAVNHADKKIYTKTTAEGVVELIGGGGGDPGTLPTGTDGDMLYNNAGVWAVSTPFLELWDNPDKAGQRELALKGHLQFTQYQDNDGLVPAVELIGDTVADETGIRIMKTGGSAGLYGIELETGADNSSRLALRRAGTTNEDIVIETGAASTDASITCTGAIVSTGGTSQFAGILMDGTNAGINMQNLHRVFNHPDPSGADTTNVANARWVNNNYLGINSKAADANLLDGINSTNFCRSDQFDIVHSLETSSSTGGVSYDGLSGTIYGNFIGANNLTTIGTALEVGSLGTVRQVSSDINTKHDVAPAIRGLNEILELKPISFKYNEEVGLGDMTRLGFSAQDVQKVIPEVVNAPCKPWEVKGKTCTAPSPMSIRHNELIAVLVRAVQELNAKVEALTP